MVDIQVFMHRTAGYLVQIHYISYIKDLTHIFNEINLRAVNKG